MSAQTLLTASAAGFAAFYFLRGAFRDLCGKPAGSCGKCPSSGSCPAARKGR